MLQKSNRGFTLIEIMVALAMVAVAVGLMISAVNLKDSTTQNTASQVLSDMNSIEMAFNRYLSDKGTYPASGTDGFTDATFVPSYIFEPKPPTGFTDYILKSSGAQYFICSSIDVTGPTDPKFLALKTNITGKAPTGKFFYSTTACPATLSMADPAGAATVNLTYYLIR